MNIARLAWRQLRRDLKAGDIRILLAALTLAVVAVTAVGFVTDRAERALAIEANRLLGGDAVVRGDAPITGKLHAAANAPGLQRTETIELSSMIRVGDGADAQLKLGDLRALGAGFPLRGTFRIATADRGEHDADGIPLPGTVWMSRAGADTLGASVGDTVAIGDARLHLAALVLQEPDASLDYFNVAPKVFLNRRRPACHRPGAGRQPPPLPAGHRRRCDRGRSLRQDGEADPGARTAAGNHRRGAARDAFRARSRRPLPRTRRAGLGGAGRGCGGDGRAPPQRAPPVRRRGDALPRCQPAHAGRNPCRRTGDARRVRERAWRGDRVRPAVVRRPLAGGCVVVVDSTGGLAAGAAGARGRHGGAAGVRGTAGTRTAAGVGVARAAPRPRCHRTRRVAGRARRHRRHGRAAVVEGRLGHARQCDAGRASARRWRCWRRWHGC